MRAFADLAAFTVYLARVSGEMRGAQRRAMEGAAIIVETEAKAELGHYQGVAGPFPAWPELADATKADRVAQGFTENDPGLRSGAMRDSIGHKVEEHGIGFRAEVGSADPHMVFFELGTTKQPPRSVFGTAAFRKGEEAANHVGHAVFAAISGRPPPNEP